MSPIVSLSVVISHLLGLSTAAIAPHVYPDGFVERSFGVVIRDHRGFAEYSIGLNAQTAADLLAEIKANSPQTSAVPSNSTGTEPPSDPPEETPVRSELDPDGAGQHLTDMQTIGKFSGLAKAWVSQHVVVTANQEALKLENIQIGPAQRHPFSLTLKFEFQLPAAPASQPGKPVPVDLVIQDRLFGNRDGAIRHALKAQGDTMLLRTAVAPILVRADRIELQELTPQQREQAGQLEARIAITRGDHP